MPDPSNYDSEALAKDEKMWPPDKITISHHCHRLLRTIDVNGATAQKTAVICGEHVRGKETIEKLLHRGRCKIADLVSDDEVSESVQWLERRGIPVPSKENVRLLDVDASLKAPFGARTSPASAIGWFDV